MIRLGKGPKIKKYGSMVFDNGERKRNSDLKIKKTKDVSKKGGPELPPTLPPWMRKTQKGTDPFPPSLSLHPFVSKIQFLENHPAAY